MSKSWFYKKENCTNFLIKSWFLTLLCGEKSLWQSFKNKKSEMTVSKDFPLSLSWCTPFFLQTMFSWRNLQNKMDTFYYIESSICLHPFCFANFSMKTRSTEKMEYTTTKPAENPSKLSSQIFYFWNFVTEIFRHKVMLKIIISSIENCTNFLIKSWFLTLLCDKKSLWQSFKNKKIEMTVLKDFPCASSWCTPFFL